MVSAPNRLATDGLPRPGDPHGRTAPPAFDGEIEVLPGQVVRLGRTSWRKQAPRPTEAQRQALRPGARKAGSTGLAPYVPSDDAPWDRKRALHLIRRLAFGAHTDEIEILLSYSPEDAVDTLIDIAAGLPALRAPSWANEAPPHWTEPDHVRQRYVDDTLDWVNEYEWEVYGQFVSQGISWPFGRMAHGFREKLALFWHDHFVTSWEVYFLAPWLHRYWSLLREHAFGDFRTFVHEIGLDGSMLMYLNGVDNRWWAPNENYARELLELFTMGILDDDGNPNYTETDVQELSRVLTGWGVDYYGTMRPVFVPDWHDTGEKTVLGQTGTWRYNDVVPLLFSARGDQIATFICRKLYRAFVYAEPDETVVAEMAALLKASDWEIAPVLKALFKSEHFFSDAIIGAMIKSPVEHTFGMHRTMQRPYDRDNQGFLWWVTWLAGQVIFDPPTVAGWPGYRDWVDTSTISMRWLVSEWLIDGDAPLFEFITSLDSADDAEALVADLAELLLGLPPEPNVLDQGLDILLNGIPAYEWDHRAPGAIWRIDALVAFLGRLPEHQLT
ncbi:MAG: DUF1800 domain-containing protein [Bacteroidota bacterium]